MFVLVSYDVNTQDAAGRKRLRNIAKVCQNWGQRVQFSVFECIVEPAQWAGLRAKLIGLMDEEKDSLRFYFLGANWKHRVEHVGAKRRLIRRVPLSSKVSRIETSANLKLTRKPWEIRGAGSRYECYGFWKTAVTRANMTGRRVGIRASVLDYAGVAQI